MLSSTTSRLLIRSPITNIPYDVLMEIFIHCLPPYPLKQRQPNTAIAPMLLCHVCSSWRTIALSAPSLWSHLYFSLTIGDDDNAGFIESEFEFLRWWRKNHCSTLAPFLRFSIQGLGERRLDINEEMKYEGMHFIVEYSMTARYLELHSFYWACIHSRIEVGAQFSFPNLRTMEISESEWIDEDPFIRIQLLMSIHGLWPALQRLSISGHHETWTLGADILIPINWSTVTHIALLDLKISLNIWFSLIRAVPNLEWGYIDIDEIYTSGYARPTNCTLPYLSTFFVACQDIRDNTPRFVFSLLFANLHLPAVHTLALSWFISDTSYDHDVTAVLNTVLKSTPAVTTLALADNFVGLYDPASSTQALATIEYVEPVWCHAPQLLDVQLEMPHPGDGRRIKKELKKVLDIFVRDILFGGGSWLDLQNPACSIRTVTIVDNWSPSDDLELELDSDLRRGSDSEKIGHFTMASIRKHAEKALSNVVFRLTSKSVGHVIEDAWYEWGLTV